MLHCTPEEQQALKLIALAEPLHRSLVEEMYGADVVRALRELQLVKESTESVAELRPWSPALGNALRSMVPSPLSRQLRHQVAERWGDRPVTGENLVRLASWSVQCGLHVPDDQLLEASLLASRDYQDDLALDLAARIHDPVVRRRASGVMARAHFDQGRVESAANLIEQHVAAAEPADRLGGILLWAATRAALGQNVDGLSGLRGSGPGTEAVLELLAMSMNGAYPALAIKLDEFGSSEAQRGDHASMARQAFIAAMRSEVLRAAGRPESAQRIAGEGRKLLATSDQEPLFLAEFVLHREVGAALDAGNWSKTENLLSSFAEASDGSIATFGGWLQSRRGLALIMQGRWDQALRCLLPAIESLSERDPQLTLPLTIAAAAFTAARKGEAGLAGTLLLKYRQQGGGSLCGLDYATACIFEAAARELLERRSAEGARAVHSFTAPSAASSTTCQLLVLSLSVDMGCRDDLLQIARLTEDMEGMWAAAWNTYANAYIAASPEAYMAAGEFLREAEMIRLARESFSEASALFAVAGNKRRARVAAGHRDGCGEELLSGTHAVSAVAATNTRLTGRELDIVTMAIQGLTDRQIAERLMVSVRTVEAHLYRSYAKLGIRSREQLSNVIRT
jgi:DNA-binding CsgD family transcriptional regulator/tetratricopeptide (TPR) repeat protein